MEMDIDWQGREDPALRLGFDLAWHAGKLGVPVVEVQAQYDDVAAQYAAADILLLEAAERRARQDLESGWRAAEKSRLRRLLAALDCRGNYLVRKHRDVCLPLIRQRDEAIWLKNQQILERLAVC
jgi:hypothetical protein